VREGEERKTLGRGKEITSQSRKERKINEKNKQKGIRRKKKRKQQSVIAKLGTSERGGGRKKS